MALFGLGDVVASIPGPESLARCPEPPPLPSGLGVLGRVRAGAAPLGSGCRRLLVPQVACEPVRSEPALQPLVPRSPVRLRNVPSAGKWRGGLGHWRQPFPMQPRVPTHPPRTLRPHRAPSWPWDPALPLTKPTHLAEMPETPRVPGSGADTREARWMASLVGSQVVAMIFGSALKLPPPPSCCPSLAPWATVNVRAVSIDDYNHTKAGQMGSTPQPSAVKFTNSPWRGINDHGRPVAHLHGAFFFKMAIFPSPRRPRCFCHCC